MADELLSPLDLAFWNLDSPGHPMYLGAVAVFERDPEHPVDAEGLAALITARAENAPRMRQRVRDVWYGVGGAAWAPDEHFDVRRHVHAVRRADTSAAVAELMSRPMDREHPPWEVYVIEGAPDAPVSVLVKLHHALADGLRAVEFGAVLLDQGARPAPTTAPAQRVDGGNARPAAVPAPPAPRQPAGLHLPALPGLPGLPALPDPRQVVASLPSRMREAGRALGIGSAVLRASLDPGGPAALGAAPRHGGAPRRFAGASLDIDDMHRVRKTSGGTVNDVVMAVVAGALRRWMESRGDDPDGPGPRALIPVARRRRKGVRGGRGNRISGYLLRLPVGEADPLARLRGVREGMDRNKAAGPDTGPGAVALLADSVPPLAHRFAAPLLAASARLLFDVLVTNVPMLDVPLTLDGCRMTELHPIAPLARGQSLAVAISTYRGRVHIGLFADATAVPDTDALAAALHGSLAELLAACGEGEDGPRRQP
ncbi:MULTISPECIES: wax ester/triacylglycerol synthase family O-acyltransferase [unclassified Streptomyces]|uniref:wax ester/triacylglycerol synthase family O-acyltransferase n=1 Tax=unclassified Streptomyces TaxID=2593676 RepID=UPI00381E9D57